MKALLTLALIFGAMAQPALAAVPDESTELKGCAAKEQRVQNEIARARAAGNTSQLEGLQIALGELQANCTDDNLKKERENKVLEAKREVSQRQADLDKAMKKGDPEKINKRKDKLAEARKELQEAVDELDK
jgi:type II secretory pathway component PulM